MDLCSRPHEALCARLQDGDIAALARGISLVDSNLELGSAVHRACIPKTGQATVLGLTGPPGVGKSTLISEVVSEIRAGGERVAVVAVDPSSPLSGGAVLGDRTRMGRHTDDPGVFIRSVSARGHLGGLSMSILQILDLIDAAGWENIIIETVGAGQSETEIAGVADISVVLNAPGLGDDVQAIKAGILEIADVLVVNKFDLPQAEATERQLRAMLKLRPESEQDVPVVCTAASEQRGIAELLDTIRHRARLKFRESPEKRRLARGRRMLAQRLADHTRRCLLNDRSDEVSGLIEAVSNGQMTTDDAMDRLLRNHARVLTV